MEAVEEQWRGRGRAADRAATHAVTKLASCLSPVVRRRGVTSTARRSMLWRCRPSICTRAARSTMRGWWAALASRHCGSPCRRVLLRLSPHAPTPAAAHSASTCLPLCCSLPCLLLHCPQDCNTAEVGAYKALRRHPRRVSTPEAASLIYLPIFEYTSLMLGPCNGTSHIMRMQALLYLLWPLAHYEDAGTPQLPSPPPVPRRLPCPRTAASAVRGRPSHVPDRCRLRGRRPPQRYSWSRRGGGRGGRTISS